MKIRRLSPELCDDYLRFFDETPHDDNRDESKCYCVCWSAADSTGCDFSSAEKRRALAEERGLFWQCPQALPGGTRFDFTPALVGTLLRMASAVPPREMMASTLSSRSSSTALMPSSRLPIRTIISTSLRC